MKRTQVFKYNEEKKEEAPELNPQIIYFVDVLLTLFETREQLLLLHEILTDEQLNHPAIVSLQQQSIPLTKVVVGFFKNHFITNFKSAAKDTMCYSNIINRINWEEFYSKLDSAEKDCLDFNKMTHSLSEFSHLLSKLPHELITTSFKNPRDQFRNTSTFFMNAPSIAQNLEQLIKQVDPDALLTKNICETNSNKDMDLIHLDSENILNHLLTNVNIALRDIHMIELHANHRAQIRTLTDIYSEIRDIIGINRAQLYTLESSSPEELPYNISSIINKLNHLKLVKALSEITFFQAFLKLTELKNRIIFYEDPQLEITPELNALTLQLKKSFFNLADYITEFMVDKIIARIKLIQTELMKHGSLSQLINSQKIYGHLKSLKLDCMQSANNCLRDNDEMEACFARFFHECTSIFSGIREGIEEHIKSNPKNFPEGDNKLGKLLELSLNFEEEKFINENLPYSYLLNDDCREVEIGSVIKEADSITEEIKKLEIGESIQKPTRMIHRFFVEIISFNERLRNLLLNDEDIESLCFTLFQYYNNKVSDFPFIILSSMDEKKKITLLTSPLPQVLQESIKSLKNIEPFYTCTFGDLQCFFSDFLYCGQYLNNILRENQGNLFFTTMQALEKVVCSCKEMEKSIFLIKEKIDHHFQEERQKLDPNDERQMAVLERQYLAEKTRATRYGEIFTNYFQIWLRFVMPVEEMKKYFDSLSLDSKQYQFAQETFQPLIDLFKLMTHQSNIARTYFELIDKITNQLKESKKPFFNKKNYWRDIEILTNINTYLSNVVTEGVDLYNFLEIQTNIVKLCNGRIQKGKVVAENCSELSPLIKEIYEIFANLVHKYQPSEPMHQPVFQSVKQASI